MGIPIAYIDALFQSGIVRSPPFASFPVIARDINAEMVSIISSKLRGVPSLFRWIASAFALVEGYPVPCSVPPISIHRD